MEPSNNGAGNPKQYKNKDEHLSEDDLALKNQLQFYVETAQDSDPALQRAALDSIRQEIRSSTSSLIAIPKQLKFLRPHYGTLKSFYETMQDSKSKNLLADILSVLALTMSEEGKRESLRYRLLGSEDDDIGSWGHEYVRNLAGEVAHEYTQSVDEDESIEDLWNLVHEIFAFLMKYNAVPEAVDFLLEVEDLDLLTSYVNKSNYKRTCLYLTAAAKYLASPNDMLVLNIAYTIYFTKKEFVLALQIALFLENLKHVSEIFEACNDLVQKQQFCYILARHGVPFILDEGMVLDDDKREQLQDIINNAKLSEIFLALARDVEVMEAKSPEDIYMICRGWRIYGLQSIESQSRKGKG
ncbi:hypothetical protein KSS87_001757, partial [Heliosperma pusillum]